MTAFSIFNGLKKTLSGYLSTTYDEFITGQDVTIKFLSAEGLPNMDLLSSSDPYFIAKIDDKISLTSTILTNTLSPKWDDEEWIVRNIPMTAKLSVAVYDKDDGLLNDDYIGQFEITDLSNYRAPAKGHSIRSTIGRHQGYFHLTIQSNKVPEGTEKLPRYTFDGPCRFTRHNSTTFGCLTNTNADCGYSTWKIQMRRIPFFFRPCDLQPWNRQYPIAQAIFDGTARSIAKQNSFKLAHKILYGRTMNNSQSGRLTNADDLWKLIFFDEENQRMRKCIYTYIIDDNTWRFSETGVGYFTDFASKHALHANCSEYVHYAGQFHPRPKFGWDRCDDEWELVFDNWSGTYSPSPTLLIKLKELLEFNFPGLNVVAYDFKDPRVNESMEKLKLAEDKPRTSLLSLNNLVLSPSTDASK